MCVYIIKGLFQHVVVNKCQTLSVQWKHAKLKGEKLTYKQNGLLLKTLNKVASLESIALPANLHCTH